MKMGWKLYPAAHTFQEYRDSWDRLNKATHNHILLDSSFVVPLIENFGTTDVQLGVYDEQNHVVGLVLMVPGKFGFWQTFQPAQAPIGLLVVGRQIQPHDFVKELIKSLPGFALGFSFSQLDPEFLPFAMTNEGFFGDQLAYIQTARIHIVGTFEDYWAARPKEIIRNLDKRKRRLEREGVNARLISEAAPSQMRTCVKEFGDLENTGWKGREGTAVSIDNAQGAFYISMMERLCSRGEGIVYKWLLDDQVVASNLCVRRGGMLVILKTAYSDEKKAYSPGLFLHKEMLNLIFQEETVKVIEFYGKVLDWHRNFSEDFRQMFHVTCYRHPLVRMGRGGAKRFLGRRRAEIGA